MGNSLENMDISWHPGFYGAMEIELIANKGAFEFQREYNLSKEPVRMDLLIIRKLRDVPIKNEIGYIFKKYNVVEYKSPDDELTIDDYYKTVGYACLYKGLGDTVNQIPAEELTVSIFRHRYPRELFRKLIKEGFTVEEVFPGIYYVRGRVFFDTQIVVTSRLKGGSHKSLRLLSANIQKKDAREFIREAIFLSNQGDRNNMEAVLQVSIAANREIYNEIRRQSQMSGVLRDFFKEEIEEEIREAKKRAEKEVKEKVRKEVKEEVREEVKEEVREEVKEEVREELKEKVRKEHGNEMQETVIEMIKNLMANMNWTLDQAMSAMSIPAEKRGFYRARL